MNVNKKLDRFKQWAGERMGGEVKTSVSDDFKALEVEMGLRHEGMEKLQKSMNLYVKALSKRNEVDDKEKTLPVAHLGGTMLSHGEDFESDSEFGQCLSRFGRTQERIARIQETYITNATTSWLESVERSLVQMKEYQNARKKLETRRLAYDASLAKMQKAKREDFRVEEELRSQKAKYEETSDDIYRRMQEIKESEGESVADLEAFLDAELTYYDACREALLQLKNEWPATKSQSQPRTIRPNARSRSNTAHSYADRFNPVEEEPPLPSPDARPPIKSTRAASYRVPSSPMKDYGDIQQARPSFSRSTTFEGPTQLRRDVSPIGAAAPRLPRVPSDTLTIRTTRSQLRTVNSAVPEDDVFHDQDDSTFYSNSSPDRSYEDRSISPATSHGSQTSKSTNSTTIGGSSSLAKKGPPPPPPSRAKKPPPPPPPAKRSLLA